MADTCKVSLKIYIQQPDKDPKGNIIGTKWVERKKKDRVPRNVSVKVTAEIDPPESTCLAQMSITVTDKGVVLLNEGPAMPDNNTCTRYQERVYYCTGFKEIDKNKEVVTFHVDADCTPCKKCEGKASDDGKVHFIPD